MGSAIIYSKKLKGKVVARPCHETGNTAMFFSMLSKKPCRIENLSFDDTAQFLLMAAEEYDILADRTENSVCFKGSSDPMAVYKRLTEGLFDDYTEIPHDLVPGEYFLRSDVPLEMLIGLITGLALLDGDSHIVLTNTPECISDIELVLHILGRFGVLIEVSGGGTDYVITGGQPLCAEVFVNEADWKQAAFYLLASSIGADITVEGLHEKTIQSGVLVLNPLKRMGARFIDTAEGMITEVNSDGIFGVNVDASECPEMLPAIMAAASVSDGTTIISEFDSIDTKSYETVMNMRDELVKLGAQINVRENCITIVGKKKIRGGARVSGHGDIVSSLALLALAVRCEKALIINDFDKFDEIYPGFIAEYKELGGCIG